jgi:uncharacterized membrane protein YgdD (TMEM256/DUF423 family)
MRSFVGWGALCCGLAVVAGAFGAHGLAGRLDAHALQLWETAARYLMYGGLGQGLVGLLAGGAGGPGGHRRGSRLLGAAGVALLAGTLVFSGTVAAIALGGPRWLGAVTPLGGLLVMAGFFLLSWVGFESSRRGVA